MKQTQEAKEVNSKSRTNADRARTARLLRRCNAVLQRVEGSKIPLKAAVAAAESDNDAPRSSPMTTSVIDITKDLDRIVYQKKKKLCNKQETGGNPGSRNAKLQFIFEMDKVEPCFFGRNYKPESTLPLVVPEDQWGNEIARTILDIKTTTRENTARTGSEETNRSGDDTWNKKAAEVSSLKTKMIWIAKSLGDDQQEIQALLESVEREFVASK
jgi:hypothetical protein